MAYRGRLASPSQAALSSSVSHLSRIVAVDTLVSHCRRTVAVEEVEDGFLAVDPEAGCG